MAILKATSFQPEVPMTIAILKAGENDQKCRFGAQVRFPISGGTFYLDVQPASEIERDMRRLGIPYGEPFSLTRAQTGGFIVRRANGDGDAPRQNGTGAVSQAAPAAPTPPSPSNTGNGTPAAAVPATMSAATQCMCSAMCSAVDAAIETQAYAQRKGLGLTFSEESVRAIGLSIYISACQGRRS